MPSISQIVRPEDTGSPLSALATGSEDTVEISSGTFCPAPDTQGSIQKIFVNFRASNSPMFHAELELLRAIADHTPGVAIRAGVRRDEDIRTLPFLKKEDPRCELEKVRQALEEKGIGNVHLFPLPETVWARDIGVWGSQGKKFLIPAAPFKDGLYSAEQSPATHARVELLKAGLGVDEVYVTDFSFEGGDFIAAGNRLYVSYSCFKGDGESLNRAGEIMGAPVLEIGSAEFGGVFPHLDSGVTFLSDNDAIIDDPRIMADLLLSLSPAEFSDWEQKIANWYSGRDYQYPWDGMPHLTVTQRNFIDLRNVGTCGTFGHDMLLRTLPRQIREFEAIERQLEEQGINVIKVPGIDLGFPLSPVNGIADVLDGRRRLFGMTLGCDIIDQEVRSIIESSGKVDELITSPGWPFILRRGGNRCAMNVLRAA